MRPSLPRAGHGTWLPQVLANMLLARVLQPTARMPPLRCTGAHMLTSALQVPQGACFANPAGCAFAPFRWAAVS